MEDIFNKDITVINKYIDKETRKPKYKVSYVKGFWSSNDGISINGTQLTKNDGLGARILVKDFTTTIKLVEDYREVIKIKDIATKDYGSEDMWHFAITGA